MSGTDQGELRRKRWLEAQSFCVYYGFAAAMDQATEADVWVVDPHGFSHAEIESLQDKGCLVLSYISLTELHPSHEVYNHMENDDFLQMYGVQVWNEEYGNRIVDLRSARWQNWLAREASRILQMGHYDGLFLDTLGNVEAPYLQENQSREQIRAAAGVVQTLRSQFPSHLLIQNNGVQSLCHVTAQWLDGLCWEGPLYTRLRDQLWATRVAKSLEQLATRHAVKVWRLTQSRNLSHTRLCQKARKAALKRSFLWYNAPKDYL